MDELLFELHAPDGRVGKIYANGKTEGFPHGTILVNHYIPLANALRGKENVPSAGISDK